MNAVDIGFLMGGWHVAVLCMTRCVLFREHMVPEESMEACSTWCCYDAPGVAVAAHCVSPSLPACIICV